METRKEIEETQSYKAMTWKDKAVDAMREALKCAINAVVEETEAELRSFLKYRDEMPEDMRIKEMFRLVRRAAERGFNQAVHTIQPALYGGFSADDEAVSTHR